MQYGDFSSLVQLGVGLHAGTALLQLYGDLGVEPLKRRLQRISDIVSKDDEGKKSSDEIKDELDELEGQYRIFKIRLFNDYKKYVKINFLIAAILIIILTIIAFNATDTISYSWITVFLVAFSVLPAPVTLLCLWIDANRLIKPMDKVANELEKRALAEKVQEPLPR